MVQFFQGREQYGKGPTSLGQLLVGMGQAGEKIGMRKKEEKQQSALSRILSGQGTQEDLATLTPEQQLSYAKIQSQTKPGISEYQNRALDLREKEAELRGRGFGEKADAVKRKQPDVIRKYIEGLIKDDPEYAYNTREKARINREVSESFNAGDDLAAASENALSRMNVLKQDIKDTDIQGPGMFTESNMGTAMFQIMDIMNRNNLSDETDFRDIARQAGWNTKQQGQMWKSLNDQIKNAQETEKKKVGTAIAAEKKEGKKTRLESREEAKQILRDLIKKHGSEKEAIAEFDAKYKVIESTTP